MFCLSTVSVDVVSLQDKLDKLHNNPMSPRAAPRRTSAQLLGHAEQDLTRQIDKLNSQIERLQTEVIYSPHSLLFSAPRLRDCPTDCLSVRLLITQSGAGRSRK